MVARISPRYFNILDILEEGEEKLADHPYKNHHPGAQVALSAYVAVLQSAS